MQIPGITSLLLYVITIFTIYIDFTRLQLFCLGITLSRHILSLITSVREIVMQVNALNIHLGDLENMRNS